jgi:uncharacterized membrane protein HdeD (DUF308 family)
MFDFLKKIKASMVGSAAVTVILGLILLIHPLGMTAAVCSLIGWFLLLLGIFGLGNHFLFLAGAPGSLELWAGIIEILLGIYIISNPGSIVKFVFLIMAVILLVHGFHDMEAAIQMKKSGYERWWWTFAIAVLTILLGVLALTKPFESTEILLRVIGASLLFDGLSDLWIIHKSGNVIRSVKEKTEPIDVDAKIR